MFVIRNVASLIGMFAVRSALGDMWPRSNPEPEKSVCSTRYHVLGRAGSGRKVLVRPDEFADGLHTSARCQLTQFGVPFSRLYDSENCGFVISQLFGSASDAFVGLPMTRLT